jgi:hypothetical protein
MASFIDEPFIACMIVPTGIGASVGGYAGDAGPALKLLSSVCDVMITHPNVANGAGLFSLPANGLYVEGYGLDQFFKGHWQLQPVRSNRIGVLLDCGMPEEAKVIQKNTVNAVQAVLGLDILTVQETRQPVQVSLSITETGASSGDVLDIGSLIEDAQTLQAQGAEAIALVVSLPETESNNYTGDSTGAYTEGQGVDPIGGIEAILSHTLVKALQIPVAHAPVFEDSLGQIELSNIIHPKAAAESITPTFLPCVLQGLSRAPQFLRAPALGTKITLNLSHLDALVVPANALGGMPTLTCLQKGIPVIAVTENTTVCDVRHPLWPQGNIWEARTYFEACGFLQALRQGVPLPAERMVVPETDSGAYNLKSPLSLS